MSDINARDAYVVVGSGPTAAAAIHALVRRGIRVVVIDTGLELEAHREDARARLASHPPSEWNASDVELMRYKADMTGHGLAAKQLFGSDVVFRDDGLDRLDVDTTVGTRPSFAFGGLSNVWGAGLLTYGAKDVSQWPVSHTELEHHAREVLSFVPYTAREDRLAERFPVLVPSKGRLERSDVGESVLRSFERRASSLAAQGVSFGGARLAVRAEMPAPEFGCVYCGRCLDGCPYGHIYSSATTISELQKAGRIEYHSGLHVDCVDEEVDGVAIEARAIGSGERVRIAARCVFLAAGTLSTTLILQRSRFLAEKVTIHDSQTLYLPFLWLGAVGQTGKGPGYTLAQAFAILEDDAVSGHSVHLSLYTYNDGLAARARVVHPFAAQLFAGSLDRAARRLVTAIAFLHSDDSHALTLSWRQSDDSAVLDGVLNDQTPMIVHRLQRALWRKLSATGLLPLPFLSVSAPVGGGYHYGASMPMATAPHKGQSDVLGRPHGSRRVHAVDATCFPSIPGGTIALPAMANAHRIATDATAGPLE